MNNRIDRAIAELMEMVDRVMGRPVPVPTAPEEYQHQPTQVMVGSGLAAQPGRTRTNVIIGL